MMQWKKSVEYVLCWQLLFAPISTTKCRFVGVVEWDRQEQEAEFRFSEQNPFFY